jgi:hypothetical protein
VAHDELTVTLEQIEQASVVVRALEYVLLVDLDLLFDGDHLQSLREGR